MSGSARRLHCVEFREFATKFVPNTDGGAILRPGSKMLELQEKIYAVNRVETCVAKQLHDGQCPRLLLLMLFDELKDAIRRDKLAGEPMTRKAALRKLQDKTDPPVVESTFRSAIKACKEALTECRPNPPGVLPVQDDREGVACVEETIGGVLYLVIVRGPYRAGDPGLLQLEAEFLPRTDLLKPRAVVSPKETANSRELPQDIDENLREIRENILAAERLSRENPHSHELIRRHLSTLIGKLEHASKLWAFGQIETEYQDFSLLTAWVAHLTVGEELLGLTDWDRDWQWWESLDGRAFFSANELAISQKATIRRIFVHRQPEDPERQAQRLAEMQRHLDAGVHVRSFGCIDSFMANVVSDYRSRCVLRAVDEKRELRGWITYSVHDDDEHPGACLNVFSINPQVIRDNERMLEGMWSNATAFIG